MELCACSKVLLKRTNYLDDTVSDSWECDDCKSVFVKQKHLEVIQKELTDSRLAMSPFGVTEGHLPKLIGFLFTQLEIYKIKLRENNLMCITCGGSTSDCCAGPYTWEQRARAAEERILSATKVLVK